jgi:hypothetical protein
MTLLANKAAGPIRSILLLLIRRNQALVALGYSDRDANWHQAQDIGVSDGISTALKALAK